MHTNAKPEANTHKHNATLPKATPWWVTVKKCRISLRPYWYNAVVSEKPAVQCRGSGLVKGSHKGLMLFFVILKCATLYRQSNLAFTCIHSHKAVPGNSMELDPWEIHSHWSIIAFWFLPLCLLQSVAIFKEKQ